jgi:Proteasome activator pa28 beta subunit
VLTVQKFKNQSKEQALDLLDKSIDTIDEMRNAFSGLFPYVKLSDAATDFIAFASAAGNDKVASAVSTTLDTVQAVSHTARTLEYFIQLHIPAIEDGGNFGVSAPARVFLKSIADCRGIPI